MFQTLRSRSSERGIGSKESWPRTIWRVAKGGPKAGRLLRGASIKPGNCLGALILGQSFRDDGKHLTRRCGKMRTVQIQTPDHGVAFIAGLGNPVTVVGLLGWMVASQGITRTSCRFRRIWPRAGHLLERIVRPFAQKAWRISGGPAEISRTPARSVSARRPCLPLPFLPEYGPSLPAPGAS